MQRSITSLPHISATTHMQMRRHTERGFRRIPVISLLRTPITGISIDARGPSSNNQRQRPQELESATQSTPTLATHYTSDARTASTPHEHGATKRVHCLILFDASTTRSNCDTAQVCKPGGLQPLCSTSFSKTTAFRPKLMQSATVALENHGGQQAFSHPHQSA